MSDETIGETLAGRYRILEKLGEGGMGSVYKALDTRLQRLVALKVLRLTTEARFERRPLGEVHAQAALNHPNLAQVYDSGETDGLAYLAEEYIEGRTLRQIIANGKPLDLDYAIEIMRQVAAVLGYAHQQGFIHRDVKPSNLLVSNEGRVILLDFGLAVPSGNKTLTQGGTIEGTVVYMSPEQVEGRPVDPRSDLFSLGVVFYELITGRKPFPGVLSTNDLFRNIAEAAPVAPRQINPSIPPLVEDIVLRLLAKEPGQRFQSAEELLNALGEEGVRPRRPGSTLVPILSSPSVPAPELMPLGLRGVFKARWRTPVAIALLLLSTAFVLSMLLLSHVTRALPGSTRGWTGSQALGLLAVLWAGLVSWLLWRAYALKVRRRRASPTSSIPSSSSNRSGLVAHGRTDQTQEALTALGIGQFSARDREPTEIGLSPYTPTGTTDPQRLARYPSAIAWVLLLDGQGHGHEFRLTDSFTIGRQADNDLVLLDSSVSRHHARISLEAGRFYISDLETRHGTFVNGTHVQKQELRDRDEIRFAVSESSLLFIQAACPPDLTVEAKRKLREFDAIWDQLTSSARHD